MRNSFIVYSYVNTYVGMTLRARLLRGVYTEHFVPLSTGSVNVLAMTPENLQHATGNYQVKV